MTALRVVDVRGEMPWRPGAAARRRAGPVLGVAIHHSATANPATGLALDTAGSIFAAHVAQRGWDHGGYHYLVRPNGLVEYALDEAIPGYHAGFADPSDRLGLARGQFWNEHYLAVCVLGWFEANRVGSGPDGQPRLIPNFFTKPSPAQWSAVAALVRDIALRHGLAPDNVRGHRELAGCRTRCPGDNFSLGELRAALGALDTPALISTAPD